MKEEVKPLKEVFLDYMINLRKCLVMVNENVEVVEVAEVAEVVEVIEVVEVVEVVEELINTLELGILKEKL